MIMHPILTIPSFHCKQKSVIPSAKELQLYSYDFNDMPLSELDTCRATVRMFMDMGVCDKFHVPYEVLCLLTLSIP